MLKKYPEQHIMTDKKYETMVFSGNAINCYGLEIVKVKLKRLGYTVGCFDSCSHNDVLFSLYWPEQIYDFIKFRYQSFMKNRKIIVGGNTATSNPAAVVAFDSEVYLGDGELFDGSGKYLINKNSKPKDIAYADYIQPILYEDIQQNRRAFCEMSRGCKNKCMFCQYGWLKKYRECDISDIVAVINKSKTKSIRMFAADRFQHSKYLAIRKALDKKGKCDTGSDVSLRFLLQNEAYTNFTNKVRVGIEGMSERLRRLVGKPYSDEDIIRFCKVVVDSGIKSLDFYMIYGLPTENKEDVDAFNNLIQKLDNTLPAGYTIAIHWNAFTPSAQTPFQWCRSSYLYDDLYLKQEVFQRAVNKKIKLMHKPKLTSKKTILKRMLAIRGNESVRALLYTVSKKPVTFNNQKQIIKEFEKQSGFSLAGEIDIKQKLPWDKYVVYDKEKMITLYNEKLG